MIEVENLSKQFNSGWALKNVNLRIKQGEKVSLFGPNGAGKTTFLRILACLTDPSAGSFTIFGYKPHQRVEIMKILGMSPQAGHFYEGLTVRQNLEFYGKMYKMSPAQIEQAMLDLLDKFNLTGKLNCPVYELSKGMRQRLLITKALLHDPKILLLDEPYSGLDLESAEYLTEFLKTIPEKTVITATHDFDFGIKEGQRVIIFNKGKLVFDQYWEHSAKDFRDLYRKEVGR